MFESFHIGSGELVEAIISGIPSREDQISERLSEEMKEYNRLALLLEGEIISKYYPDLEKKKLNEKTEIVMSTFLSKTFEPSLKEDLLKRI
jgi:pyrimidine operon attenuation protein/uracil phosphoribosyltransferase